MIETDKGIGIMRLSLNNLPVELAKLDLKYAKLGLLMNLVLGIAGLLAGVILIAGGFWHIGLLPFSIAVLDFRLAFDQYKKLQAAKSQLNELMIKEIIE